MAWVKPSRLGIVGSRVSPCRRYCGQHTFLQGSSRMSRNAVSSRSPTTTKRCRDKSPIRRRTQPLHRAYGVGGLHKTTPPSSSDHRVPAAYAATAGGFWVLLDEYRNLGDDSRKNASGFSAMTGLDSEPPRTASVGGFLKEFRTFPT